MSNTVENIIDSAGGKVTGREIVVGVVESVEELDLATWGDSVGGKVISTAITYEGSTAKIFVPKINNTIRTYSDLVSEIKTQGGISTSDTEGDYVEVTIEEVATDPIVLNQRDINKMGVEQYMSVKQNDKATVVAAYKNDKYYQTMVDAIELVFQGGNHQGRVIAADTQAIIDIEYADYISLDSATKLETANKISEAVLRMKEIRTIRNTGALPADMVKAILTPRLLKAFTDSRLLATQHGTAGAANMVLPEHKEWDGLRQLLTDNTLAPNSFVGGMIFAAGQTKQPFNTASTVEIAATDLKDIKKMLMTMNSGSVSTVPEWAIMLRVVNAPVAVMNKIQPSYEHVENETE